MMHNPRVTFLVKPIFHPGTGFGRFQEEDSGKRMNCEKSTKPVLGVANVVLKNLIIFSCLILKKL